MSFRTTLAISFLLGMGTGAIVFGSSCSVYDDSLLLDYEGANLPDGGATTGVGWWSGGDEQTHCFSAGVPSPKDRPKQGSSSTSIAPIILAMTDLRLGSRTPDGSASETAWQDIGFDLDHTCTRSPTCDSIEMYMSCKPKTATVSTDGNYCRDNMFGKFEYMIESNKDIASEFKLDEDNFNCSICRGAFNMVVQISSYNGEFNDPSVRMDIFPSPGIDNLRDVQCGAASWDHSKCWTSTDAWRAQEDFVVESNGDGIPTRSKLSDPSAFVRDGYLVAKMPSNTKLWFPGYRGYAVAFPVVLQNGVVVGKLSKNKQGKWLITEGVIGGSMKVEDTVQSFRDIGMCPGNPLADSVKGYAGIWADVLSTGDVLPDTPCDALSVGIGFGARQATLGHVQKVDKQDLCADAGTGGSGGSGDAGTPDAQ